jgi:predicted methyltransferase
MNLLNRSLDNFAQPSLFGKHEPTRTDEVISRLIRHLILNEATSSDWTATEIVASNRPSSIRAYDQIPMQSEDLLCQVKLMTPYLAKKAVVFVGDHDSTSLLLGLLTKTDPEYRPSRITIVDFDERLLCRALDFAQREGFSDILDVELYNVFDPVPGHLLRQFDWFYTNPPYGASNKGESARLFITRGIEMSRPSAANACIILPHDLQRDWTGIAMRATQSFLCNFGWTVDEKINAMHRYYLDDDKELASSVVIVKKDETLVNLETQLPYAGRRVAFDEISRFYGRSTFQPYPRFIRLSGEYDWDWSTSRGEQ